MSEGTPVTYFDGGWIVSRVCPYCGKFVKIDDATEVNEYGIKDTANATCKKCGRVKAPCLEGGEVLY